MIKGLVFHHTGIAVRSIDAELDRYSQIFGKENISKKIHITSQKVNVCFVDLGNQTFYELIEDTDGGNTISKLLDKGISYYHTAFFSSDIESHVSELTLLGYRSLGYFKSEAFDGKRCVFLLSRESILLELIEI